MELGPVAVRARDHTAAPPPHRIGCGSLFRMALDLCEKTSCIFEKMS